MGIIEHKFSDVNVSSIRDPLIGEYLGFTNPLVENMNHIVENMTHLAETY